MPGTMPNTPPESRENLVGRLIDGRYEFMSELGSGGMGTVYRARHVALEREVAIKVLRPQLASQDTWIRRFMQEARAASKIRHVNVVETVDFGTLPDGAAYCVMELLEGRDLSSLIRSMRTIPWPRVRSILIQMVRGLGAAHTNGVIHRDVKPANCFLLDAHRAGRLSDTLGGPDLVKMLDFGIAKVVGDDRGDLTATNELIGTATYMAPERAARGIADIRADIYSVGIVAYKMLTGTVPFRGETMFATLSQHVHAAPPSMVAQVPGLPPMVEQVVFKALAKQPDARYQTMTEFEQALLSVDENGNWVGSTGPMFPPPPDMPVMAITRTGPHSITDPDSATEVDSAVSSLTESSSLGYRSRRSPVLPIFAGVGALLVAAGVVTTVWLTRAREQPMTAAAAAVPETSSTPEPSPDNGGAEQPEPQVEKTEAAPVRPAMDDEPEPEPPESAEDSADEDGTPGTSEVPPDPEHAAEPDQPDSGAATKTTRRSKRRRSARRDKDDKPAAAVSDGSVIGKLRRKARGQCGGLASGSVVVKFSILSSGRASMVRVAPPHEHSAAGKCVRKVVEGGSFPEGGKMRASKLEVKL